MLIYYKKTLSVIILNLVFVCIGVCQNANQANVLGNTKLAEPRQGVAGNEKNLYLSNKNEDGNIQPGIPLLSARENSSDECDLIGNGKFETGLTLEEFDRLANTGNNKLENIPLPGWFDLGFPSTADVFFRGSQVAMIAPGVPASGIPLNEHTYYFPSPNYGVETPTVNDNNVYIGMVAGNDPDPGSSNYIAEGIYTQLSEPLVPGNSYILSYATRAIDFTYSCEPDGEGTVNMRTYFTSNVPVFGSIGTDELISNSVQIANPHSLGNNWTNVSIQFEATESSLYLVFTPITTVLPPNTNLGCMQYFFFDNVRLIKIDDCSSCEINLPLVK